MPNKPEHVERGGEVRADTEDKWSEDDTARQEHGLPHKPSGDGVSGRESRKGVGETGEDPSKD